MRAPRGFRPNRYGRDHALPMLEEEIHKLEYGIPPSRKPHYCYPYPPHDNPTNQKGAQSYHLVYLENEYVKIAIAPELVGRLFSTLDKTNGYDFVYKQHLIKTALIGLIGAWISTHWLRPRRGRATSIIQLLRLVPEPPTRPGSPNKVAGAPRLSRSPRANRYGTFRRAACRCARRCGRRRSRAGPAAGWRAAPRYDNCRSTRARR